MKVIIVSLLLLSGVAQAEIQWQPVALHSVCSWGRQDSALEAALMQNPKCYREGDTVTVVTKALLNSGCAPALETVYLCCGENVACNSTSGPIQN